MIIRRKPLGCYRTAVKPQLSLCETVRDLPEGKSLETVKNYKKDFRD